MRKLIASTLVTLDGVVEDPGGFSDFEHGGWAGRYFDEQAAQESLEQLRTCEYFLCGRVTYEFFAKYWPQGSGDYADHLNSMPKLVASTTLSGPLEWNATVVEDIARIAEIKQQPGGDIVMYGSGNLLAGLMRHGLVDEYEVTIFPIVLGAGRRLFEDGPAGTHLQLAGQEALPSGVVSLSYRPADS